MSGTPEGVKQVFAVNGRDKGTFDPLYMKFEELLTNCKYIVQYTY